MAPPSKAPPSTLSAGARAGRYLIIGIDPEGTGEIAPILDLLDEVTPLGVILFARNMSDRESLDRLIDALTRHDPELLLAIDHEGGRVHRLPAPYTHFPPALTLARTGDPGLLREVGRAQGLELRAAGFHINFAPVLDVHTNPDNPIIGDRAFGTTPEEVIHNALPYLQGLGEAGITGCGKHFPGHGDTTTDSHLELPRIDHSSERLRTLEMAPFARAIAQGVPMIMTAHILCPALDRQVPASLSHTVIDGVLRRQLGFTGVVVSDDLEMRAVADFHRNAEPAPGCGGIGEAAVRAITAGSDIVLVCKMPERVREAHRAIARALADGRIRAAEEAAAERRRRKLSSRIAKLCAVRPGLDVVGAQAHRRLASRISGIG